MAGGFNTETQIALPWPPKELTPNFKRRKHWSVYRPFTRSYRETCALLTKSARNRAGGSIGSRIVAITFYPPDRRKRDDDGIISAFKAGRDGVADGLGVDDHTFRPAYYFDGPVKGGQVVVSII